MEKVRTISTLPLDGGTLAFHFINTVYAWRKENLHEYLTNYQDVLSWSDKVKALPPSVLNNLHIESIQNPAAAKKAYKFLIESRQLLYQFFSSVAENKQNTYLISFDKLLHETLTHYEWRRVKKVYQYGLNDATNLFFPLWAVMYDAHQILTKEKDTGRIKECGHCGWIFLDTTKNKQRRWCNTATCGSVDKLRKYYLKNKSRQ